MAGGVFVYKALASATITPASGGTAVSIDTTSSEGGSHTGTALGSIIIQEGSVGDIALGIHTLTAPDGWNFTNDNVDIAVAGATELTVANDTINSADGKTLSFNISATSTTGVATLTFTGIKVHPTGETPITGNITLTSGTITGVDGSTNFGTLTSIPGVVTKLAVTTQPTDTIYGSSISDIVIKTQDQFGNNSTSSLGASKTVNVSLSSGTGSLSGTTSGDIGTNDGNGILTFSDLKINAVGTGDKLTFAAESLTSAVSDAFDITAKSLTVTGATVTAKTYDGTKNATISGATLSGVEAGDTVTLGNATTGTFSDADAATGISVGTAPMTISGDDAGNYTLTQPTLTGDINKVQLTIAAPTITKSKIYDGATTAEVTAGALTGVVEGEDVDVSAAADYDSENVGTSKTITVVYTLTGANIINYLAPTDDTANDGAITSKQLTIADPTLTTTKVYDKTTTAEVTAGALTGVVDGDVVTVSVAADYDSENVGTGKTITIVYTLGGTDAGNYTKPGNGTDATGVITAKSLTVTGATVTAKTYDGTKNATISGATLSGVEAGDTVTLGNATTGTFSDADAATGISVGTAPMTISGDDAGNYTLTQPTLTGDINKVQLTIAAPTITKSKIYDGATTAEVTAGALTGVVEGEDVDVSAAADYDSENVGTSKTITVVYTLTGANIINYLAPTDDTANDGAITSKQLTIADPTLTTTKVYDKTTTAEVTAGALTGVVDGDVVTVSVAADYDSENVGTGKTITIVYTLGGTDAGNYTKPGNGTDATGVITAKSVNVTAQTDTKVYNGNNISSVLPVGGTLIAGDTYTSVGTQTFADANAGAGKTITPAGAVINDGNSGNNYSITYVTTTGTITKANPTITWSNPADITAGTALSDTQLNATATGVGGGALDGGFGYNPATGTQLTVAGSQELSVEFTPTNTTNYNTVSATTSVNIIPAAASKLSLSVSPTSLAMGSYTTLTVTIQDAYSNTVTSDNSTVVKLSADNGGSFPVGKTQLTVTSGVATTTLTKNSDGTSDEIVNLDAEYYTSTRILAPTVVVTFTSTVDVINPIISDVSATSTQTTASITFQSNENGQGTVSYNSLGITPVAPDYQDITAGTPKTITLGNLTCGTSYNYSVNVKDSRPNFATPITGSITTLSCAGPDVTPPPVPVISTTATTTDANSYVITGTVGADTPDAHIRTISVYNGEVLAGTTNVPIGQTNWTVYANLNQDSVNSFTAVASDPNGNTSSASDPVIITEDSDAGVDTSAPTFVEQNPTNGSTSVSISPNLYVSFNEALDFNSIGSTTVMLCLLEDTNCSEPVDIGSPMLTELGKVIRLGGPDLSLEYNESYWIKISGVKNLAGLTADDYGSVETSSFTTETAPEEPSAGLTIDTLLTHTGETSGLWSEDGGYGDAYEWVFAITLPNDETFFALQFEDWTNGLNIDDNMRYWSEEITTGVGSSANPVIINEADTYPDFIEITSDNSPWSVDGGQAGIQTNIHVQLQIPSSTPAGSHSTNFKVRSEASIPS